MVPKFKVVLIGAGSHVFAKKLITDVLSYPELRESTICLMDLDEDRLQLITAFAKKTVNQYGFPTRIESTTDQKTALDGANYVIVSIRVGGHSTRLHDLGIPAKYGVKQAVGDTIGPGGVFYGLRHVPVLLGICHDMEQICPGALLINYTNPMAILNWVMNDYSSIKNVGLCHSVQSTSSELARYIRAPYDEISYRVAGINHMAWFLEFKWNNEDAYPLLRERLEDPSLYSDENAHWAGPDNVRVKIFKTFGYFNTESSQHMSEYVPYFRKNGSLFEEYNLEYAYLHGEEELHKRLKQEERMRVFVAGPDKVVIERSDEYAVKIIHSIETGKPSRINGNVRNNGLITNLPWGCSVEVPCLVDKSGIQPTKIGKLPPQCAGLNRTNINVHELAVLASVEKSKTLTRQAILLDPLTSAILGIDETHQMVDELFEAESKYLMGFK